ncbi:MAG: hypothetical protein ABDH23_01940 [Endomicrobiia bacterium]
MKESIQEDEMIKVLKYKFASKKQHIYISCVIFANMKTETILKISCIASFDPLIYEMDLSEEYKKIENMINKYKLESKSCFDITKKVYVQLYKNEEEVIRSICKEKINVIDDILINILDIKEKENVKSSFKIEKLKFEKNFKNNISSNSKFEEIIDGGIDKFFIKTKPVIEEKKGISVEKIKPKNEILCEVVDKREIVKYIMQTLFSKELRFLYSKVTEVNFKNKNCCEIICNITPVIFTKFIVDKKQKLIVKK